MDDTRPRNVLIVANRTADTEESAITLELAIPLLEDAAGGAVEGLIGGEDPFLAVSAALEAGRYDEIIVSTLPARVSHWLHIALPVHVVLEPARRAELAPLIVELYGPTAREREVTQLLISGMPIDEMARSLWISRYTVRDHAKAAFSKVGVTSRPELTAMLFHEHFRPNFGHSPVATRRSKAGPHD